MAEKVIMSLAVKHLNDGIPPPTSAEIQRKTVAYKNAYTRLRKCGLLEFEDNRIYLIEQAVHGMFRQAYYKKIALGERQRQVLDIMFTQQDKVFSYKDMGFRDYYRRPASYAASPILSKLFKKHLVVRTKRAHYRLATWKEFNDYYTQHPDERRPTFTFHAKKYIKVEREQ